MSVIFLPYVNIRYRLTRDADSRCVLVQYKKGLSDYVLRSRAIEYVDTGQIIEIPTGIAIEDYPEYRLNVNETGEMSLYMEAECKSYEELLIEHSVMTVGPRMINKEYGNNELWVTLHNTGKKCVKISKGMPISVLSFTLKPRVQMQLDNN